ncbi:hypothetical protein EG329_011972 [Mollisiaceae sp. DMI_Dod_QoI]|nr:hypothetical protein EG329_011972 [Helotiales sp. DMI_Dod_QoI]
MTDAESFVRHLFEQKGFKPDPYDSADICYEPGSGTRLKDSENLRENSAYHEYWTCPSIRKRKNTTSYQSFAGLHLVLDVKRSPEEKEKLKELEKTNEAEAMKQKDDEGKLVMDKLRAAIIR